MNRKTLAPVFFATILAAPLAFASGADTIMVMDPSVRAVPPGQDQTAAYLTLHNQDKQDHALVKAASPAAKVVELHTVIHENGVMKMRPVEKMEVKAGTRTELKPGGLHIMLIGLKAALKEGDKVSLTLGFEDGSHKAIEAVVKPIMPGMKMKHGQH